MRPTPDWTHLRAALDDCDERPSDEYLETFASLIVENVGKLGVDLTDQAILHAYMTGGADALGCGDEAQTLRALYAMATLITPDELDLFANADRILAEASDAFRIHRAEDRLARALDLQGKGRNLEDLTLEAVLQINAEGRRRRHRWADRFATVLAGLVLVSVLAVPVAVLVALVRWIT